MASHARRFFPRGVIILTLGALTTFAVSALLAQPFTEGGYRKSRFASSGNIRVTVYGCFGVRGMACSVTSTAVAAEPDQIIPMDSAVPGWARHELLDWTAGVEERYAARLVMGTGWPMLAMWSSFEQQPSPGFWWFEARDGYRTRPAPSNPDYRTLYSPREVAIPLRVIPLGFVVNTAFYGAWWALLLVFGPFWIRRILRVRRGRCLGCGYLLRGLPSGTPCPECGRVASMASAQSAVLKS